MGAAKAVGGILALAGSAMVLIFCLLYMNSAFFLGGPFVIGWIINLLLSVLALVGSIVGLAGKKVGGALALIAGLWWLLMDILLTAGIISGLSFFGIMVIPYSLFATYVVYIPYITLESILCLIGGILILADSD
ncbi:MAG: hypothetical protein ACFFD2_02560 [Promethearchaeota archaeon]